MNIVNLTPHAITFYKGHEPVLTINPSGQVARVSTTLDTIWAFECDGELIPVTTTMFGDVEGLPEPAKGTIYVVSSLVAQRVGSMRNDIFIPNESVRDERGRIIGCRSLGRI